MNSNINDLIFCLSHLLFTGVAVFRGGFLAKNDVGGDWRPGGKNFC